MLIRTQATLILSSPTLIASKRTNGLNQGVCQARSFCTPFLPHLWRQHSELTSATSFLSLSLQPMTTKDIVTSFRVHSRSSKVITPSQHLNYFICIKSPLLYKVTFTGSGHCNLYICGESLAYCGQLYTPALLKHFWHKHKMTQCLP